MLASLTSEATHVLQMRDIQGIHHFAIKRKLDPCFYLAESEQPHGLIPMPTTHCAWEYGGVILGVFLLEKGPINLLAKEVKTDVFSWPNQGRPMI